MHADEEQGEDRVEEGEGEADAVDLLGRGDQLHWKTWWHVILDKDRGVEADRFTHRHVDVNGTRRGLGERAAPDPR